MLRWRARRHPSLEAVWFEGKTQTYGELNQSSSQLAAGLVDSSGSSPATASPSSTRTVPPISNCFLRSTRPGLVIAPLNWRLTAHEMKSIIDDIKPKLIVVGAEFKPHGAAECADADFR